MAPGRRRPLLIDYTWEVLADRRGHWFVTHLLDLAVVALPVLRPIRLLRPVTLVSILKRRASL